MIVPSSASRGTGGMPPSKKRVMGVLVVFVIISAGPACVLAANEENGTPCDSPIYCFGELLKTVQVSGVFDSSKDFVDRPLRSGINSSTVSDRFTRLGRRPNSTQVRDFVDENFAQIEEDLEKWVPEDHKDASSIQFFQRISDKNFRRWAEYLHKKWTELVRKESASLRGDPSGSTLIELPHPFVVNGFDIGKKTSRFRELRYWDSFFTVHGLLISGMEKTAKGIILNFADMAKRYGYVPIGNRIYYLRRPQMPMLSSLVHLYWTHTSDSSGNDDIVRETLPAISAEYEFWIGQSVPLVLRGKQHSVAMYKSNITAPRPESYREDYDTVRSASGVRGARNGAKLDVERRLYSNIAAASASGWEFSTRWLDKPDGLLTDIRIDQIIPVDLNSYLCATERHLGEFYKYLGNDDKAKEFFDKALLRAETIQAVFWNDSVNMWRDYDLHHRRQREQFFMSAISPLYAMCGAPSADVTGKGYIEKILASADTVKALEYAGGMPVSFSEPSRTCYSCQWDFPNSWPTLQLQLIEGIAKNADFMDKARELAQKLISNLYEAYINANGAMFERYDASKPGFYGRSGEYHTHEGFAPTNGVVLRLLEMFPGLKDEQNNEIFDPSEAGTEPPPVDTADLNLVESPAPEIMQSDRTGSPSLPDPTLSVFPPIDETRQASPDEENWQSQTAPHSTTRSSPRSSPEKAVRTDALVRASEKSNGQSIFRSSVLFVLVTLFAHSLLTP